MNDCDLGIYYDNPNEASDMYLKWLLKDCEENDISVKVYHDAKEWDKATHTAELYLEPILDPYINIMKYFKNNVDDPSATAQGIYDYIIEHYPNREHIIAVIGRGLVGKQLIDKLIDYGYTVCEFNSKSNKESMIDYCHLFAEIIVGLSTEQVFNQHECNFVDNGKLFIDAANNFDTKNKLRCGKWTRQVIIDRIKKLKGEEI